VVTYTDDCSQAQEIVRASALERVHIVADYFAPA
jgi:L-rhamnose isomerase